MCDVYLALHAINLNLCRQTETSQTTYIVSNQEKSFSCTAHQIKLTYTEFDCKKFVKT